MKSQRRNPLSQEFGDANIQPTAEVLLSRNSKLPALEVTRATYEPL